MNRMEPEFRTKEQQEYDKILTNFVNENYVEKPKYNVHYNTVCVYKGILPFGPNLCSACAFRFNCEDWPINKKYKKYPEDSKIKVRMRH